jgi:phenylpyruvate tautomerase PptA (4-oxalocrotonate tautomerase family)
MPFARISLVRGKPAAYRAALAEGVYQALRSAFQVAEGNRFAVIHQHDAEDVICDPAYGGVERSGDLVLIQMSIAPGRTPEMKRAFFAAVVENLGEDPGLRPDDIHIHMIETTKDNWSLGRGAPLG